jgi:hypothetical protein
VEISAALAADLKALTDALDEPGVDLEHLLHAFGADTRRTVDSYLGLTMTLIFDDFPISLATMDPVDVATSLRLPLNALCDVQAGSALVLYADKPGAFVDLAADLSFALGLTPDVITLDDDLNPASSPAGIGGLTEMSHVNQAIGILIARGHLPDNARTELDRLANQAQTTVHVAAQQLIRTTLQLPAAELPQRNQRIEDDPADDPDHSPRAIAAVPGVASGMTELPASPDTRSRPWKSDPLTARQLPGDLPR